MTINSRRKGANGERELAKKLREYGFEAKRDGQQGNGNAGDHPDVDGLRGLHIECKRVERLQLTDAMLQSRKDARPGELPIVAHKKNNEDWYVTMWLADWVQLYKAWESDID